MFQYLGNGVVRAWPLFLVAWIGIAVGVWKQAPAWESIAETGELSFLPADSPTFRADRLRQEAFPEDDRSSNVVVVVAREGQNQKLRREDRQFVRNTLLPRLKEVAGIRPRRGMLRRKGAAENPPRQASLADTRVDPSGDDATSAGDDSADEVSTDPIVSRVWTINQPVTGQLLLSEDRQACLALVELTTEFLDKQNNGIVAKVEKLLEDLRQEGVIPQGTTLSLSGSAVVGRDMREAMRESASSTEAWTVALVIGLLLVIYRSPFLAAIPLITVFIATEISLKLLSILAGAELIRVFEGLQSYITVITYGAGVDFALFLTARYREGLESHLSPSQAIAQAIGKVGAPLAASAGTQIIGIGMLTFAAFGKFHLAGIGIPLALAIVLCASLTFTPALLCLAGRWAFWPWSISPASSSRRLRFIEWISFRQPWLLRLLTCDPWDRLSRELRSEPTSAVFASLSLMLPFAAIALLFANDLSYGLLSQLPTSAPSVAGTATLERHFPGGAIGPMTVLIRNEQVDFTTSEGRKLAEEFTNRLYMRRGELQLADIRSVSQPLGRSAFLGASLDDPLVRQMVYLLIQNVGKSVVEKRSVEHYVSHTPEHYGHVTRMDLVLEADPLSRDSIQRLAAIEEGVKRALPAELAAHAEVSLLGPTAGLRDLKSVADQDRTKIYVLVVLAVFSVLVLLLRNIGTSSFLIFSVVFSYLATLGMTYVVFRMLGGSDFPGLYWTVPTFLFTVLVAVGADYNIFLVSRIEEEREQLPPLDAIHVALTRTGRIISSCGIIMAGTFSSLLFGGTLAGMQQLGFALAFGVLLDTFVVRPVLVPAFLILVHNGQLGFIGRLFGGPAGSGRNSGTPAEEIPAAPNL